MDTSIALAPSVLPAFRSLIDYAGLYPPASLGMADAVAEYKRALAGPHAWMLGKFIVPSRRLGELLAAGGAFPLSVIIDNDSMPSILTEIVRRRLAGARIQTLEVTISAPRQERVAALGSLAEMLQQAGLRHVPTYVEMPGHDGWLAQVPQTFVAAGRSGLRAKIRCGGTSAEAFPGVDDIVAFVRGAVGSGIPFKATAGLHHPVRRYDEATGFTMHGFLNLFGATVFAPRIDDRTLRAIVFEEDPSAFSFSDTSFLWRTLRARIEEIKAARARAFVGYGSCSFTEPVDDLTAMRVLPHHP